MYFDGQISISTPDTSSILIPTAAVTVVREVQRHIIFVDM